MRIFYYRPSSRGSNGDDTNAVETVTEGSSSLLDEVDSRSTAEGFWSRTDNETRL
jgi:hypothetical protein